MKLPCAGPAYRPECIASPRNIDCAWTAAAVQRLANNTQICEPFHGYFARSNTNGVSIAPCRIAPLSFPSRNRPSKLIPIWCESTESRSPSLRHKIDR